MDNHQYSAKLSEAEDTIQELTDSISAKDSRLLELQEEVYALEQRIIDLNKISVDLNHYQKIYQGLMDESDRCREPTITTSHELYYMTGYLCHTAIICTKALVAAIKEKRT